MMKVPLLSIVLVPLVALTIDADNPPYGTSTKPKPSGNDFSKLVPVKVGEFTHGDFKAPQPGLDGEATYRSGKKEIFMLFSKADTKDDLKQTMETILGEIKENTTTEAREVSLKTSVAYIHFLGPKIAFFAWTRELYCFSADSKNGDKKVLEEFMKAFPY